MSKEDYLSQPFEYNAVCLLEEVLWEVVDETTPHGLWRKLEKIYLTKSLTNQLYLKQRLYRLRVKEGMFMKDHLTNIVTGWGFEDDGLSFTVNTNKPSKEVGYEFSEKDGLLDVCDITHVYFKVFGSEVSPLLRSALVRLGRMVGLSYVRLALSGFASNVVPRLDDLWMWPSLLLVKSVAFHTFRKNRNSLGGLPNCDIESIVCLEKGESRKFCMGCIVENYVGSSPSSAMVVGTPSSWLGYSGEHHCCSLVQAMDGKLDGCIFLKYQLCVRGLQCQFLLSSKDVMGECKTKEVFKELFA
ncbi:Uncharacterized protein TCM_043744 [Theobroma cacao]|uniref:Uncharacterized protein n=1 Tax=Theobroma cacao TaxID=3641 RepID=A0A061FP27_THECC|nr:Uncharacterized protein TCM_043744 [Theobroma cacao]